MTTAPPALVIKAGGERECPGRKISLCPEADVPLLDEIEAGR